MRYYFDLRDGDQLFPDEQGLDLSSLERAQEVAARSLVEMAREWRPRRTEHRIGIAVRDDYGPVFQLTLALTVERQRN